MFQAQSLSSIYEEIIKFILLYYWLGQVRVNSQLLLTNLRTVISSLEVGSLNSHIFKICCIKNTDIIIINQCKY